MGLPVTYISGDCVMIGKTGQKCREGFQDAGLRAPPSGLSVANEGAKLGRFRRERATLTPPKQIGQGDNGVEYATRRRGHAGKVI